MLLQCRGGEGVGPGGACAPPEVVNRYIFNVSVLHQWRRNYFSVKSYHHLTFQRFKMCTYECVRNIL